MENMQNNPEASLKFQMRGLVRDRHLSMKAETRGGHNPYEPSRTIDDKIAKLIKDNPRYADILSKIEEEAAEWQEKNDKRMFG